MANTIRDYSATPANNTVVDGADISEGCSPAGINDAIRGVMSDLKDVSTGAVALESPAFDSASLTGDLTFGDSDKAIFGAGSDLQIYHDGGSSWVSDVGAGNLKLTSDGAGVFLQKGATEFMGEFLTDGAVRLYHDNAAKFATTATGVDVTGEIRGILASGTGGDTIISAISGVSNGYQISVDASNNQTYKWFNGGTQSMTLNSSGNVGIGTSSPSGVLAVTDGSNGLTIGQSNENFHAANTHRFYSQNYSTERMRIDSSGRVTMPYQPSFLAGGMSATQTTDTSIPFNSTGGTGGHNIGNHFSTSTGKFTCPIAGRYFFSFNLLSNDTRQNYFYAHLRKNGSVVKFTQEIKSNSTTSGATISTSMVVDCAANDVVDVFGYGSSVNIHSSNQYTWFSGYLLG